VNAALLLGGLLLVSACATPIGVSRVDHTLVYRTFTRSALSGRAPSLYTEQLLSRRGLTERFEAEPAAVIAELHRLGAEQHFAGAGVADGLFVLAELSFLHAERAQRPEYYLASAIYAMAFLTHPDWRGAGLLANAVDPRARMACDFYNLGLVNGLMAPRAEPVAGEPPPPPEVLLADRTLALPFGEIELRAVPERFLWGGYRFSRFISPAEYEVRGLRNRYRQAGLGAPLLAEVTPVATGPEGAMDRRRIPPRIKVPVTATVKIPNVLDRIAGGRLRGTIEIDPADAGRTVEVNGVPIPLELDPSAALAYMLEGAPVWDSELAGFLKATRPVFGDGLVMMQPYRPGRVPVVLVHGTASSPARWAEIVNEVQNDPLLGQRVQIWLFTYNTSNPILYSARLLREALQRAVQDFDPSGRDPALRRMVVMGHSQGGLLTRLMVTDSGSRFWDAASRVPFPQLKATPEERSLLESAMFFEPLPFVKRVVFMATPHRGSYRASRLVLNLVRRLVTLPLRLVQPLEELIRLNPGLFVAGVVQGVPTAVDNMSPTSPFARTLSDSPIAPGVTVHSIIAVEGSGDLSKLSDGVVRYESAHLEGVASEKVVQSEHSMQAQPETILEVRRILREHLGIR
jgi:pimeloyl-ACP methyl ester carboxylesterase